MITDSTLLTRAAQLEDTLGDAGACDDRGCGCHSAAADAREELDLILDATDDIDAWKRLRDAGYDELELRAMAGDR